MSEISPGIRKVKVYKRDIIICQSQLPYNNTPIFFYLMLMNDIITTDFQA